MQLLTYTDLSYTDSIILDNVKKFYPNSIYYFNLLRQTGCRPSEPLIPQLWFLDDNGTLFLQQLKNNNIRQFDSSLIDPEFIEMIVTSNFRYEVYRLAALTRAFHVCNIQGRISTFTDHSALYFYRYFKAKSLYENGMSMVDIQSYFGWVFPSMAPNYVSKNLYRL